MQRGDKLKLSWSFTPYTVTFQPTFTLKVDTGAGFTAIPGDVTTIQGDGGENPTYQASIDSLWLGPSPTFKVLATFNSSRTDSNVSYPAEDQLDVSIGQQSWPGLQSATIRQVDGTWEIDQQTIAPVGFDQLLQEGNPAISLRMIWIQGGQLMMGSLSSEADSESNERNSQGAQHQVQVPGFYMSQTPITHAQWRVVASWQQGNSALAHDPSCYQGDELPIHLVGWNEAMEFCNRLSQRTGRNYTLPSESKWEYACRAGTTSPFAFGQTLSPELANYIATDNYANGPTGGCPVQTTVVKRFYPNSWGLYDMHGNVLEWCLDEWHDTYDGAPTDGSAWSSNSQNVPRLLRGGSWLCFPRHCRSAVRHYCPPGRFRNDAGFRVVCLPQGCSS